MNLRSIRNPKMSRQNHQVLRINKTNPIHHDWERSNVSFRKYRNVTMRKRTKGSYIKDGISSAYWQNLLRSLPN